MAYTTINKSTDYFNTKLFTGTGSSNALTGIGFQPDWVWIKDRQDTHNHNLFDAVRGVTKRIHSDTTDAETTNAESLKSFDSDGFTLGTQTNVNQSGHTNVAWNWKANGAGSANTDGTINTTATSVNTTAGFSIVKFTGSGANATVGHGLGVAPKMYILKRIDGGTNAWLVYHDGLDASSPQNYRCVLNQNTARQDMTTWNDTAPTNSVFSVGSDSEVNGSGQTYIVYCFAEKTGYSKFGSYVGNGNADGSFIYTGFKPAFVMFKRSDGGTENWGLLDSTRSYANVANHTLAANLSNAESSFGGGESVFGASNKVDILSNGIKIREASNYNNTSGATYIYMCFASAPLVGSNNVPCTAR